MKRRNKFNRRGFTLIEMVAFLITASVLLMLSIQLIHASINLSSTSSAQWKNDSAAVRMIRDLRRDAFQATDGTFDQEAKLIRFTLESGSQVEWSFRENTTITRQEVASKKNMEAYPLGSSSIAEAQAIEDQIVRVTLASHFEDAAGSEVNRKLNRLVEIRLKSSQSKLANALSSPIESAPKE